MKVINILLATLCLVLTGVTWSLADPLQLSVHHSVDEKPFTLRGHLTYDPTSSKKSSNKYEPEVPIAEYIGDRDASDRTIYRVRVEGEGVSLTASMPLCLLKASEYQEQLALHLDSKNVPWHLDYLVSATSCDSPKKTVSRTPKTKVLLERAVEGPRPKLEQIVETTPDGKPPKEQSFIQKYWYYIVPIMIMLMLGGGQEEPQQGGGARR